MRSHFGCKLTCLTNETRARVRQSPGRLHHSRFPCTNNPRFGLLLPSALVQVVRIQVVSISTFLNNILQNHRRVYGFLSVSGPPCGCALLAAKLWQNTSVRKRKEEQKLDMCRRSICLSILVISIAARPPQIPGDNPLAKGSLESKKKREMSSPFNNTKRLITESVF